MRIRAKRRVPLFEIIMLLFGLLYVSPCFFALLNALKTLPEIISTFSPASIWLNRCSTAC